MPKEIFKYTNGEVTVVWQPKLCIHSAICWKGLPAVFNPKKRPWVDADGAASERIIEQVGRCPSGALSIEKKEEPTPLNTGAPAEEANVRIQLMKNGPVIINGSCTIQYPDGREERKEGKVALCRCGASGNKPYCDGTHNKIGFISG